MNRGTSYADNFGTGTKGASVVENDKKPGPIEKASKLKKLGKVVRGYS
jgi:hypothetical protein